MSAEEKLHGLLSLVEEDAKDKNYVAITGFSGVGKTVLLTLLSHALDKYFHEQHKDVKAFVVNGRPILENWENSVLDGIFPKRTQPSSREDIVLEMSSSGATGSTKHIHLPDISGEDFQNMCVDETNETERVLQVIEMAKTKTKPYGQMSYIIPAKMYLILLDCSKILEWEKLAIRHVQALTTIRDFKRVTNKAKNGNIDNPIGIVLTKSDKLDNPDMPAEEIVKKHMWRFYHALESTHVGKREFFKVRVDVERDGNNETNDVDPKVRKPLTYSHEEYVRLLWWIHENLS